VLQLPLVYDERALAMGDNAARAAEAAGIRQLVVNAGGPLPPEPIGVPFLDARLRAAAADVPLVTVLQPTTYLENLSSVWSAQRVVVDGVIGYPLPADAPVTWVSLKDVAIAVERALDRSVTGWFALPGEPRTGYELARSVGEGIGRRLRWQTISPEVFGDALRPHLGDHAADGTAAVYRMLAEMPPAPPADSTLAREALDWAPRDPATWAREVAWPLAIAA
jgi:nucleoside-diphosphate-sugar epimerase